ncbi:MAG: class I SAM-dependent methyltransferase [Chloroflexota bacterium]
MSVAAPTERDFYEGRWVRPDLSAGSLRNYLVKKERFFLRQLRGRQGRLLDLGCGGGWRFFSTLGPAVGVDLSRASLRAARAIYTAGAQADLTALPFATASFDYVVSADVLGHVPLAQKDAVLAEIRRVLRPGGRTLHYVEAAGQDPLMRWARRRPDLYQRYVVAPEGHVGMETARDTFARFRQAGFRPLAELGAYRGLMYVGRVVQLFDNEYAAASAPLRALVAVCRALSAAAPLELAANLAVSAALEAGDRLLPLDWAGGVMVCYER